MAASVIQPGLARLEAAAEIVYQTLVPTPLYSWPLLSARAGCEVWVKHENHLPIGAFKLRGGLVYMAQLQSRDPEVTGVVTSTTGNHGQSIAFAARAHGLRAIIVVPEGNATGKNAAMQSFGAELVVQGRDYQEAREFSQILATKHNMPFIGPFEQDLVDGVASYALETFRARPDLDTLYVPIGMGSGICGCISARDALGLKTRIIGVVAETAPAYALSFESGAVRTTQTAETMADGVACRVPHEDALALIARGADRVVRVGETAIKDAIRHYYTDTHNLAEGAGAVPLAALLNDGAERAGPKVGLILTGGNIDREVFAKIISRDPPAPA